MADTTGSPDANQPSMCPHCGSSSRGFWLFDFDAGRWTWPEKVIGVGSLTLLVSLFLPWYSIASKPCCLRVHQHQILDVHGWLWITFALNLVSLAVFTLRAFFDRPASTARLSGDQQLLAFTAAGNLILVLLTCLLPYTYHEPGDRAYGITWVVHWHAGGLLALISTIVTAAAASPIEWPSITRKFRRAAEAEPQA
jgi:hypothetical protein